MTTAARRHNRIGSPVFHSIESLNCLVVSPNSAGSVHIAVPVLASRSAAVDHFELLGGPCRRLDLRRFGQEVSHALTHRSLGFSRPRPRATERLRRTRGTLEPSSHNQSMCAEADSRRSAGGTIPPCPGCPHIQRASGRQCLPPRQRDPGRQVRLRMLWRHCEVTRRFSSSDASGLTAVTSSSPIKGFCLKSAAPRRMADTQSSRVPKPVSTSAWRPSASSRSSSARSACQPDLSGKRKSRMATS